MTDPGWFPEFAASCGFRIVSPLERRPGNALNIEIGQPMARCNIKRPAHWPDNMTSMRWLRSGGSPLVFGNCSADCPLLNSNTEATMTHNGKHGACDECVEEMGRTDVTDEQIEALRNEASMAGDCLQVAICDQALDGSTSARRECERVIGEARA